MGDIESMKKQIAEEQKKHKEYDERSKARADNFVFIRMALQHLVEVLDNVGKPHVAATKKRPGSMLNLPLLKLDKVFQNCKPPSPAEENGEYFYVTFSVLLSLNLKTYFIVDNLLRAAKTKIDSVVKIYETGLKKEIADDTKILDIKLNNHKITEKQKGFIKHLKQKQKDEERTHKWKDYHHAIVKELSFRYQTKGNGVNENKETTVEGFVIEDPSVLSRFQIKTMSAKIVEEMSKRDD